MRKAERATMEVSPSKSGSSFNEAALRKAERAATERVSQSRGTRFNEAALRKAERADVAVGENQIPARLQ